MKEVDMKETGEKAGEKGELPNYTSCVKKYVMKEDKQTITTITIPLEHYNELLMIKGRYEELKIRYEELKNIYKNRYYEDIEDSENNFEKKLRDNLIFDNLLNNI